MKKISKDGKRIVRHELTREEALEMFKDDPYKIDLINNMDDDTVISCYTQGDFTDLCRGPHVDTVKEIKKYAFSNCYNLVRFDLPSSVKRIENNAFSVVLFDIQLALEQHRFELWFECGFLK